MKMQTKRDIENGVIGIWKSKKDRKHNDENKKENRQTTI
jgi:hypothetical protein